MISVTVNNSLRCAPQKKPSAMPNVQPHQKNVRVFHLIAQLMVKRLFLGAHFKMPFCWLSNLDVSIGTVLSLPFFNGLFSG